MKDYITGVLVDVTSGSPVVKDGSFDRNDFNSLYKLLNCTTFTIASRKIGRKRFDIYLDDEGLLKEDNIPSALSIDNTEMLVGNLLILKHDNDGEVVGLDKDDMKFVKLFLYSGVLRYTF